VELNSSPYPVVLITGAARRLGQVIARHLHAQHYCLAIHCRHSVMAAEQLAAQLNDNRAHSAMVITADLDDCAGYQALIERVLQQWGRLDALIHNASQFYPTPFGSVDELTWDALMNIHSKAPYFLAQAAQPWIARHKGSIINLVDVNAFQPLQNYSVYCISKAALVMLTQALALELAPDVRVNGVAPGHIVWPEGQSALTDQQKSTQLARVPLKRCGAPMDIARTVAFLLQQDYVTGEIWSVDGGKKLTGNQ
jgi:pteridine reductase